VSDDRNVALENGVRGGVAHSFNCNLAYCGLFLFFFSFFRVASFMTDQFFWQTGSPLFNCVSLYYIR